MVAGGPPGSEPHDHLDRREAAMTERDTQDGDGEIAVCHVCEATLATQEELLIHLRDVHPQEELLAGAEGEA